MPHYLSSHCDELQFTSIGLCGFRGLLLILIKFHKMDERLKIILDNLLQTEGGINDSRKNLKHPCPVHSLFQIDTESNRKGLIKYDFKIRVHILKLSMTIYNKYRFIFNIIDKEPYSKYTLSLERLTTDYKCKNGTSL